MDERCSIANLESIYRHHPLRAETIITRLQRDRVDLSRVTQQDLAIDHCTFITDQNHVGGINSVRELARLSDAKPGCRVLDIGCGLGGSARVLAEEFQCDVDGVEVTRTRFEDATRLTRIVGLESNVRIIHGDFANLSIPHGTYDIVWSQGALTHFPNLPDVIRRIRDVTMPGGRVAIEEAALLRDVASNRESDDLARLEQYWASSLNPISTWLTTIHNNGLRLVHDEELTGPLVAEMEGYLAVQGQLPSDHVVEHELAAWRLGSALARSGLVGYRRMVFQRPEISGVS